MLFGRVGLTFWTLSGGAFRSVKNKKLFERSEFFVFSVDKCRSSPKSAALIFSFVTFLLHQGKRKSKDADRKKVRAFTPPAHTHTAVYKKDAW